MWRCVDAARSKILNSLRCLIALRMHSRPLNVRYPRPGLISGLQVTLAASVVCLLCSGCAVCENLATTAVMQPIKYSKYLDEKHQEKQFRAMANEALEQQRATARAELDDYSCEPFTFDEECGFVDGFVDQLIYGGDGNAPPLPPRRYWKIKYQNPEGFRAMEDWFIGYRHGAAAAQASGYREYVTIPASDSLRKETLPVYPSGTNWGTANGEADFSSVPETGNRSGKSAPDSVVTHPPSHSTDDVGQHALPDNSYRISPLPEEVEDWTGQERQAPDYGGSFYPTSRTDLNRESNPFASPPSSSWEVAVPVRTQFAFSNDVRQTLHSSTSELFSSEPNSINGIQPIAYQEPLPPPTTVPALIEKQPGPVKRLPSPEKNILTESGKTPIPFVLQASLICPITPTDNEMVHGDTRHPSYSETEGTVGAENSVVYLSPPDPQPWKRGPVFFTVLLLSGSLVLLYRMRRKMVDVLGRLCWPGRMTEMHLDRLVPAMSAKQRGESATCRLTIRKQIVVFGAIASCLASGCASLTNPVQNGIPVRRLPEEWLATPHREGLQTIPLSLLRREQPEDYILGKGDVIGVFVAGVFPLTLVDQALPAPPVYFPSQIDPLGAGLPPSMGYPVTIRNDGTLALPLVNPIPLEGLTVEQASAKVRDTYLNKGILQPGRESVLVTLMQPRQIRILLFRQELGGFATGSRGGIANNTGKLGTGHLVDLRAYENDVLTAMAKTGGLPGLDAFDGIYIFRGAQSNAALTEKLESITSAEEMDTLEDYGVHTDHIPTRWAPGEPLPFGPDEVILNEGDVVLLEARSRDYFYTGGLLPAGEQLLPRDYDLDVVEAVAQIRGSLVNGAFGGSNFTGQLIQHGTGNPNPSALTVIRRTPGGGLVPISVDLNRALTDPRERILVQPDDILILQETSGEAVARYISEIFNFNATAFLYRGSTGVGVAGINQIPANR